ncbi:MAG: nitroreductase family protein [Desulfobacterales bacterium]
MLSDLIRKNRSCRRFYQNKSVDEEELVGLVNLARLSASGANLQPLVYILSCEEKTNADIFSCLAWAGYLNDWAGPVEGERPSAYIVMLGDTEISKNLGFDPGIAGQSILLGAREKGLGGCMLGAVQRDKLSGLLDIPPRYSIPLVIAIGKPKETVEIETMDAGGSIKYWRDEDDVHHVPKRGLEEIILHFNTP